MAAESFSSFEILFLAVSFDDLYFAVVAFDDADCVPDDGRFGVALNVETAWALILEYFWGFELVQFVSEVFGAEIGVDDLKSFCD